MTRFLSQLLDAQEPSFRLNIRELERASGQPSADIRLSADIMRRAQDKLQELGLDRQNTTGQELYEALRQRLLDDDKRLKDYLHLGDKIKPQDSLSATVKFVSSLDVPRNCYALKLSVAKRLMNAQPPKRTMKQLGYRSIESMLKHEPLPQLFAAALVYESASWQHNFHTQYLSLNPGDFESREISIYQPLSSRWQAVAQDFTDHFKHISVVFKELGAIVVLPAEADIPALSIVSVLLMLEGLNEIRCSGTYLKLQQMGAGFGAAVLEVATSEPTTKAHLAGRSLPWRILQHYYDSVKSAYQPAVFEPHVQPEDLSLAKAEQAIAEQVPALEFWQDTAGLALVHGGAAVSMNMLDVALSVANRLPFERRLSHYLQAEVWQNLLTGYLDHQNLDQVMQQFDGQQLAEEPALITAEND